MLQRGAASTYELPALVRDLINAPCNSAAKFYVTWKTLAFRQQRPRVFQRGSYVPLHAMGEKSEHIIALARQHEGRTIIVAVPRLCAQLMGESHDTVCEEAIWRGTTLEIPADGVACYHNLFTGECLPVNPDAIPRIPLSDLFRNCPVALLVSEPQSSPRSCGTSS
jgi:(1->4)-alpha-D-glucan 1-alpha-D-glucosylmutase